MERLPRPIQSSDRILMVRLGAVGDVLRTLPAVHLLRQTFPALHISWIVEDLSRDLLIDHPDLNDVIRFPRSEFREAARRPWTLPGRLRDLGRTLRAHRFTVAIDAQGSFKSAAVAALSGAPRRIGFAPGLCREMSFLLTSEWVRLPVPWLNRVDRNLRLAEALGARGDEITMRLMERDEERREAEALLREVAPEGTPVVILSPGTSRRQRYKMWPVASYARLGAALRRAFGALPLISWGPGEESLAADVARDSGGAAVVAPPVGLRLLASLLRRAALFIGADTGPMHLAWGVGCPVIAIFGPTDPRLNAPLGPVDVVLCGAGSTASVSPDQVLSAARRILSTARGRRGSSGTPPLSRNALFGTSSGTPA
jgi:lipopolysaccharide heptosyltransferase I